MKKNWPYILVLLLVVAFLFRASKKDAEKKIDWRENYTGDSKSPFGCYVAKDFINSVITAGTEDVDRSVYTQLSENKYSGHNYIFINNEFQPTAQDVIQLCKFVARGNTVMVSARTFGLLEDTLKFNVGDPLMIGISHDSIHTFNAAMNSGSQFVQANLVNPSLKLHTNTVFDRTTYNSVFINVDTTHTTVLGKEQDEYVNFVKIKFGLGSFYIHTLPDAFANYYAANPKTSPYLFRLLSYLPDQPTFFDEHYKAGHVENDDSRRYVLSEPSLRLGYLVVIITGLIALFFGGKRRQRAVPVVAPPTNATLEFVEQIGTLYYRQGDHGDLVRKKINYFLESIRTRFYTQTNTLDEKFVDRIHNLSGVPREQVQHLFATIDYRRILSIASDKELKELENLIWEFNQRSKR